MIVSTETISIIVILLALVLLIGKFGRVKNLKLLDWLSVEYFPFMPSKIQVSTKTPFGIVVSQDGKIYKLQIEISIKADYDTELCNVSLLISGVGWFVFRQFFKNVINGRVPKNIAKVFNANTIDTIGIEFEPKNGWDPISIKEGQYKCLISLKFIDKVIKHKFKFQVRSQNIQAMNNKICNQPVVIKVPIII